MNYKLSSLWLILLVLSVGACTQAPNYPIEPVLTYEGLDKNRIFQYTNGPRDSINIRFSFTDGDGDISQIGSDSVDIFLEDSRLPGLVSTFRFPLIDEEGTSNGISGTADILADNNLNICCIVNDRLCVADPDVPIDTFSYSIQIRDRANNFSNVIRTDVIEIICIP